MNEQAIQDAYNLFVANGYKKSIDDFKKLIASNEQALNDSYSLFTQNGYKKSIDDFKGLMGVTQVQAQPEPLPVKKKEEPVPSSMELPSEDGKLVSPKPTETVTVGPMGMTGLQRTAEYQPAKEFEGKGVGYVVGDLLKTAGKGVVKFPADVLETASIVTAGVKNLIAKTGAVEESDASKFAIYKGAQEYKKLLDEVIPTDRDISSGFWGQTAKAIGEMVPIILSGFASGGAKAITTAAAKKGTKLQSVINYGKGLASRMATPQGALTISQVAAPSYEQAKSEGATENEALTYAIQNALVSYPIEMLPVDGLFKRLDKNLVGNKGVEILKRAVIGGSEEAITEGIQNVYENVSANQIYGTTKEMLDGVGDASAVGGTVGAIMNGLLTALLGRRAKATTNEEKAELDKSIEEVKTKVDKINSNNEKFIETINTLEQSNPRTLTYGSAEYNFIESPDGNLELAEDDMTKEQAEGIINNLSNAYKKIEFSVEEVEPESPYKPTTYKVIGKPIKAEQPESEIDILEKRYNDLAEVVNAQDRRVGQPKTKEEEELIDVLNKLNKLKEDAIQKQAAGEVPVQPTAGISETMEEGKPQAKPQGVTEEGVQEEVVTPEEVNEFIINPNERISWSKNNKEYKVGDVIDGNQLDELSGDMVGNFPNQKFILIQKPLSEFNENRDTLLAQEKGYEQEEIDRLESIKSNFNSTPPIPFEGDGMHRIVAAKELGYNTILMWQPVVSSKTQPEVAPVVELTESEQERERYRLEEEVFSAQKRIGRADDTDAAIAEYNAAKKALEDFDAQVEEGKSKARAKSNIEFLIEDEGIAAQKEGYEYKDLYEQDPRLAALQNAKDLLEFSKSEESQKARIEMGETIEEAQKSQERVLKTVQQDIADLEADLQANPIVSLKTQPEVVPAKEETIANLEREKSKLTLKALKQFPQSPAQKKTVARIDEINAELKKLEAAPVVEAAPVAQEYIPLIPKKITHDKFTRDNAIDYEEGERETDSGRVVTYLASLTVEAQDDNGDTIGSLTKITDEDGIVSWQAADVDGNELSFDGFDSKDEAKQALADKVNKARKKEFDKQAKKKTKPKKKAVVEEGPSMEELASIEAMLDLDVDNDDNMLNVLNALDRVDNAISKRLRGGANEALLAIPLSTIQVVVKGLKVLVQGGMKLRDAIRKVAADNNLSQDNVRDIINIAPIQEGVNELMTKVDAMIERQTRRGTPVKRMTTNVDTFVRNSDVYKEANDAQKKIMEREARAKFGVAPRRAPSIGRILGSLKDITSVSREDKMKIISSIQALSKDAAKDLAKEIKQLADTGTITAKQAASIVSRFAKVNMLNEVSVSKFVDYMAKIFKNADYNEQMSEVKSMLPMARKNTQTKLGVSEALVPLMNKLFAIDPTLIPDSVFDKYTELVNMMGQRKAVLKLEESGRVMDTVEEILAAVDEDTLRVEVLSEIFDNYDSKITNEDGKVDFAGTIKRMVENGVITQDDADMLTKYKTSVVPRETREGKSEEELAEEKKVLVKAVKESEIDSDGLPMKDERDKARELQKLIKTEAVNGLDNTQLNNLLRVVDNINNGYFPHYAQLMIERLNAINEGVNVDAAAKEAKPIPISSFYSRLKSMLTGKDRFSELIRRGALFNIDQVFGDFKTKKIYNALFEKPAEAQAKYKRAVNELTNKLDDAEQGVAKSFKYNANKVLKSKFKMMTFMLQLEHDSNPGNKTVYPASQYLSKTIEHIKGGRSSFGKMDIKMLQEILDEYSDADGNIDSQKLYDSFNPAEKKAIKTIQDINSELKDKAVFTAAVIRGDKIHPLNNYIHHNVLHEHRPDESLSGVAFVESYNNSLRPSTMAKSLIARKETLSPLNFDVFASANRGAKFTLLDYYLTEPIRTARKTINEASKLMKKEKVSEQQRDIFNAINDAFEEATENLLTNDFIATSFGDDVAAFMSKQGYRAVLASIPRFVSELSSNIAFAMIAAPKDFKAGVANRGVVLSADASKIMNNVGSKQTNRIFPNDTLSGRLVDTSIVNQSVGVKGGRAMNDVRNKAQQIYNLSLKKYQNVVELMADALISTPDKMVMRPMWFGAFANQFKSITGQDVDFDKIAANDEAYMAANKEAIDEARNTADQKTVLTGATDNAFMGVLKGTPKPNQSAWLRGFNMFNNFMTNFLIYEYATARTGIMAAMGNGSISRKDGVALMAAVATRMTLYTLLTSILSEGLVSMFVDDEDEDDEKSFLQKIGQAIASSATSLFIGRDFGNATKALVNKGIEYMNEKYLDFLREGDYDPYKDAIQYTVIPPERKGKKNSFADLIANMMGPFGPAYKTLDLAYRKATETPKKEADAIERSEKEKNIRLPLEVLGNVGMIPLYKDVRKIVMKEMYKDLDNAENKSNQPMMKESDMKRYYPELWKELYGPGSAGYDERKLKKEMQKEKSELNRQIKDEMYNYVPKKKKSGFGSSEFGKQKKTKSEFGSSKFGASGFGSK